MKEKVITEIIKLLIREKKHYRANHFVSKFPAKQW